MNSTRKLAIAVCLALVSVQFLNTPAVAQTPATGSAASLVDAAIGPCTKNADPRWTKQLRDLLMIKAQAIVDGDRKLTTTEENVARGMNHVFVQDSGEFFHDSYGCIADEDSALGRWVASIMWSDVVTGEEFDPAAEADRIAKICTWTTTPPSQRDRFFTNVRKFLTVDFTVKAEHRKTTAAEEKTRQAARKALSQLDTKASEAVIDCLVETTKDTIAPVTRSSKK